MSYKEKLDTLILMINNLTVERNYFKLQIKYQFQINSNTKECNALFSLSAIFVKPDGKNFFELNVPICKRIMYFQDLTQMMEIIERYFYKVIYIELETYLIFNVPTNKAFSDDTSENLIISFRDLMERGFIEYAQKKLPITYYNESGTEKS